MSHVIGRGLALGFGVEIGCERSSGVASSLDHIWSARRLWERRSGAARWDTHVSWSLDDRRNTTRWRSRLPAVKNSHDVGI